MSRAAGIAGIFDDRVLSLLARAEELGLDKDQVDLFAKAFKSGETAGLVGTRGKEARATRKAATTQTIRLLQEKESIRVGGIELERTQFRRLMEEGRGAASRGAITAAEGAIQQLEKAGESSFASIIKNEITSGNRIALVEAQEAIQRRSLLSGIDAPSITLEEIADVRKRGESPLRIIDEKLRSAAVESRELGLASRVKAFDVPEDVGRLLAEDIRAGRPPNPKILAEGQVAQRATAKSARFRSGLKKGGLVGLGAAGLALLAKSLFGGGDDAGGDEQIRRLLLAQQLAAASGGQGGTGQEGISRQLIDASRLVRLLQNLRQLDSFGTQEPASALQII